MAGTELRQDDARPVVLHLNDSYLPLTETWIYTQVRKLRAFRPVFGARRLENLGSFPLDDVVKLGHGNPWEARLDATMFELSGRPWITASKLARRVRPRIIHAHFGPEGVRALPLRTRCSRPLVTTFYGYDVSQLPRRSFWRKHYRRLFEGGDAFLVEGPYMGERLADLGCPREKIYVQHLGVDHSQVIPAAPGLAPRGVSVLMASSFREKKGVEDGVRAFAAAFRGRNDVELRIIGDGPLRPRIETAIRDEGLERVTLLGYCSHDTLRAEIARAHIFLAPSKTAQDGDTEGGAPVVVTEAQAAGVPVVATRHADIPEVVSDEVSGILAPEGDVEALARGLASLADDAALRVAMGQAGRERMRASFDLDAQVRRLENLYSSLIGDPRGERAG